MVYNDIDFDKIQKIRVNITVETTAPYIAIYNHRGFGHSSHFANPRSSGTIIPQITPPLHQGRIYSVDLPGSDAC